MCQKYDTKEVQLLKGEGRNPLFEKAIQVDSCIADIVQALNNGDVATLKSCCGHGKKKGYIMLADGRRLNMKKLEMLDELKGQLLFGMTDVCGRAIREGNTVAGAEGQEAVIRFGRYEHIIEGIHSAAFGIYFDGDEGFFFSDHITGYGCSVRIVDEEGV